MMRLLSIVSAILIAAPLVMGVDWTVEVGTSSTFTFTPNEIHPAIGDTVMFTYLTRNHSAMTTTFTSPCPPPLGGVGPNGFDSGFHDSVTLPGSMFTTTILDTEPHWVSCMQASGAHCHLGMTLAINPTAEMTKVQFMANTINS
ncbi:hypothetical protein F5146DRAFT_1133916 [Armillaria mellea]|nr:hypothetical protein F5146DRAFT_1133916 [Armillaria mellea]